MSVAPELKFAATHAAPNKERGGSGDNQQGDKLLPVHLNEHNWRPRDRNRKLQARVL
jgi:hypothetical protein